MHSMLFWQIKQDNLTVIVYFTGDFNLFQCLKNVYFSMCLVAIEDCLMRYLRFFLQRKLHVQKYLCK